MSEQATAKKKGGWKAAARKTKYGDWTKLETLPGYSVRPQKMAVEQGAEMRRMTMEAGRFASPDTQRIMKQKTAEWKAANPEEKDAETGEVREPSITEIQELMSDAEWEKITNVLGVATMDIEMVRHLMLYGIFETDLDDDAGKKLKWNEELVDQLMEYEEQAREIAGIARRWNTPLPHGSGAS